MSTLRNAALILLLGVPLAGCGSDTPPAADEPQTLIGKAVKQATDEARVEISKENITLGENNGTAKAEITPAGELLIDGKTVPTTPEQKALLVEYRKQITGIAEAGIGVGLEGADLAGKAVSEAIKGVFTGNPDQIEQRIEAEAEGVKAAAMKLCDRLPALKAAQDKLAAALPEFKPYATMDASDVEDCRIDSNSAFDHGEHGGHADTESAHASSDEGLNAAEEAEAAGAAAPAKK